MVSFLLVPKM